MNLRINQSKYKDVNLFLWLIPAINCVNYYLTYSHYNNTVRLLVTFSIDTLQGFIAWLLVRGVILWLDKNVEFDKNPLKRISIQIVTTLVIGMAAIVLQTELVTWLATDNPTPASFYEKDVFIISIWFFVVNGIYIGLHYYQKWQLAEEKIKQDRKLKSEGFRVSTAKKELLLPFQEIAGFYVDGEYSMVVTTTNNKYVLDYSLDKVEKMIPNFLFFRLNRQYIIHRRLITGFEKDENGKINVLLNQVENLPQVITVSRTKAPDFKIWFSLPNQTTTFQGENRYTSRVNTRQR